MEFTTADFIIKALESLVIILLVLIGIRTLANQRKWRVSREDEGQRYMYEFIYKGKPYTCYSNTEYKDPGDLLYWCSFVHLDYRFPLFPYSLFFMLRKKDEPIIHIPVNAKLDFTITVKTKIRPPEEA